MRTILFLTVLACIIPAKAYAAKTFWEVMTGIFSEEKEPEPDPAVTLQAPFAYNPERIVDKNKTLPVNTGVPLDKPHRTSKEIAEWLMVTASDVLTFEAGQHTQEMADEDFYFTPSGKQQYVEFLNKNTMMRVLESGRYDMLSFVSETPLLQNEGVRDGHYRWLFEVPIMVSYVDSSGFNYKDKDAVSQRWKLNIQVRRVQQSDESENEGVAIELWSGKMDRTEKQ